MKSGFSPWSQATWPLTLQSLGHEVLWLDGINRRMSDEEFDGHLNKFQPEIVFLETKAPVVKRHWKYIEELKSRYPNMKIALMGDHVSYFPEESLLNSQVDYVMTGGDYDIVGRNLVQHLAGKEPLGPGLWYRDADGKTATTGPHKLTDALDSLPFIDRELTRFLDYGEAYLLRPTAYILTGRGCGALRGLRRQRGPLYLLHLAARPLGQDRALKVPEERGGRNGNLRQQI